MLKAIIVAALLVLVGCRILTPYKLEIPQGQALSNEQIAKVKLGMSRSQIRFILGTPLLTDPFHADRWDYISFTSELGQSQQYSRLTLWFAEDKVVAVEQHPASDPSDDTETRGK